MQFPNSIYSIMPIYLIFYVLLEIISKYKKSSFENISLKVIYSLFQV